MQNWSLTSIFEEYQRFTGPKSRITDRELIERFDGPIQFDEDHYWLNDNNVSRHAKDLQK